MHIVTPGAELFYKTYGTGPQTILLFHGAGQDHTLFEPLIEALGPRYTCYAFDLYYHGQSRRKEARPITREAWREAVGILLDRHGIDSFTVLGFSIGSRFALATAMTFPRQARKLMLVAPDGIAHNFWYWLATSSAPARYVFRCTIQHPGFLFGLLSGMRRLMPGHEKLFRFAEHQMNTPDKRNRIYHAWTAFRTLRFSHTLVAETLRQYSIELVVIVGLYDTVIPPRVIKRFLECIPEHILYSLPAGHNRLVPEIAENTGRYFN